MKTIDDIEYGDYQEGNKVSFDNTLIKEWLSKIPFSIDDLSENSSFALMEILLFEGEYMPFIRRNGNKKFICRDWTEFPQKYPTPIYRSLDIKGGKNKIYLNNKDITEKMKKRYEDFLRFCIEIKNRDEVGKIWLYWKGSKL